MSKEKFDKIKLEKHRQYLVTYYTPVLGIISYIYDYGRDITITEKHVKLKRWSTKRIHFRKLVSIQEVL